MFCFDGATHLRSQQEPQLFQGTVRDNIDPSSQYSDADLWDALEKVPFPNLVLRLGTDDQPTEPPQGPYLKYRRS
jgi:ATP-binding cassette subfamily C (CFTR/MRP) protein 1